MFTQRRKTLANALAAFAGERGQRAADVLRAAGVDPSRRPETLTLEELARPLRPVRDPWIGVNSLLS